jgi:hypothetical protein
LNRSTVSRRISSILDDIQRLTNALYAMNTTDLQRYPDNYEVLSIDAALRAEGIACRLRHLIYASTTTPKAEYLTSAANTLGIQVRCKDGIFEVTLPGLLPKRKMWQSGEYLLEPLGAALTQYARGHPLPRFQHCLIAFSHIYDQELPERRIRDYDNLELKQIQDVIASFVLTDDTGALCDIYHTTELDAVDCTRISIMEPSRFPMWLAEKETL